MQPARNCVGCHFSAVQEESCGRPCITENSAPIAAEWQDMTEKTSFDFASMSSRDRYKILTGTIVPRPIALVTTVDLEGRYNAAPISFFNCLSSDPALLVLGIAR